MIDLRARHLEVFLAVAEEMHFGRAARRLGVAQSAVSQQVRRLEDTLGVVLLQRTSRRVELTPAGLELCREAPDLLARLDGMARSVRAFAAGEAGTVDVGAQGAALITIIPSVVAHLARDWPNLRIETRQLSSQEQINRLLLGSLDIGLVREVPLHPGLVLTEVLREPVVAVLPQQHPLAGAQLIELADLAQEPFVLWGRRGAPQFHDSLMAACRRAGFTPRVAHRVRGIDARLSYIAAGLGVGLEAASYSAVRRDGVVFRPLQGSPVDATLQLVRTRRRPTPAAARVEAIIRRTAAEPPVRASSSP